MSTKEDIISADLNPSFLYKGIAEMGDENDKVKLDTVWSCYLNGSYEHAASMCQILIDESWEEMNTGHWKDVDMNWRYLYSYASLLKCLCLYYLDSVDLAIKTCDMGLLMGAPILGNILANLVSRLSKIESKDLISRKVTSIDDVIEPAIKRGRLHRQCPSIDEKNSILRVNSPSLMTFEQKHMKGEIPIIIENSMTHWPAMDQHRWSLDYIKSVAGSRTVPIEIGSKYTSNEWTQKLLTINEFIDKYILLQGEMGYLAQHQLFEQIPDLKNDIIVPDYCCLSGSESEDSNVMINAWFGPEGTISPLHHDPYHNLFAQVVGSKYIRLYDKSMNDFLYPHENSLLNNTSQVDVENWDENTYPKFRDASYLECILHEGEMLYIPPKWWHYVRSLSLSFSVSFWWK